MSADPTMVVAFVGLVGTLGAAALTQFVVIRNKRLDAEIQHRSRVTELTAAATADKLATYVQLNAASRDFRSVGHDYLVTKLHGKGPENLDQIEEARAKYREIYARAQMVLPDQVFWLAAEVNDCLGQSYRALHDLDKGSGGSLTGEKLHQWYDGPLEDALKQLRYVLREDLGVAETRTDANSVVRRLRKQRLGLWPIEVYGQANSSEDGL